MKPQQHPSESDKLILNTPEIQIQILACGFGGVSSSFLKDSFFKVNMMYYNVSLV